LTNEKQIFISISLLKINVSRKNYRYKFSTKQIRFNKSVLGLVMPSLETLGLAMCPALGMLGLALAKPKHHRTWQCAKL
jgi:hypothetical protein